MDWQFTRYDSPIFDLIHFIYACTDSELRNRHFDDLLYCYHGALCAQLMCYGIDGNELFSFKVMMQQLKIFGRYALKTAVFLVPYLFTDQENAPDMNELNRKINEGKWQADDTYFDVKHDIENEYVDRMSGILTDMNKRGFF